MLCVENLKTILQAEVNKREKSKAKWKKYHSSCDDKHKEDFYYRRYHIYCTRFDAMCDLLFDLGYQVWCNSDNKVIVEKLVEGDNYLTVDVPF